MITTATDRLVSKMESLFEKLRIYELCAFLGMASQPRGA